MEKISCHSCGNNKVKINAVKSRILHGLNLMMCDFCLSAGFEPRWVIIIGGRQNGASTVKDYVVNKKYSGEEIVASELLI